MKIRTHLGVCRRGSSGSLKDEIRNKTVDLEGDMLTLRPLASCGFCFPEQVSQKHSPKATHAPNMKNFSGEVGSAHSPLPRPLSQWGGGHPSHSRLGHLVRTATFLFPKSTGYDVISSVTFYRFLYLYL